MRKWIIAILVIAAVAAGLYFFGPLRPGQDAASAAYQTEAARRGSLTAMVGATGVVRANQTAVLTWQTTGTVGDVNVRVGDAVMVDDVLAALEQTSLPQNVILAQADLVTAQRTLEDLKNSRLQSAQALRAVESAEQALEDARNPELAQARALEAIATAQKVVENAERTLRNTLSPANQTDIDQAKAQVVLAEDRLNQAQDRYEPYANRPESNVTRARLLQALAQAQQQYDAAVRNYNALLGTTNPTDRAVAEANLETAKAQLLQAQRDYERIKDGPSEADIRLLEAQLADAQRDYERVRDGAAPEDVAAAEARLAAAQATLNQARLLAPFAGAVTEVVALPGDQVAPGARAFRIDDLTRLLVDVQVSEVDINRITLGQAARLAFDAIPNKEYTGEVSEVSPVGNSVQGVVDFTVTIELTDPDQDVRPGMTAAVNIVVNELQDVLLVPNRAVRVSEGSRVVYVLKDNQAQPVEIVLGASSESDSQVLEGELQVGDAIILNPPTVFDSNGPPPFVRRGN
jgi:HlyD family secretion protein